MPSVHERLAGEMRRARDFSRFLEDLSRPSHAERTAREELGRIIGVGAKE